MMLPRIFSFFTLFLIGISAIFVSCATQKKPYTPLVVVTIPPYQTLVKAIGGDTIKVASALPPGYDPHTSEMTPRHMHSLDGATLFIGIGEPYEHKLRKTLLEANPKLAFLELKAQAPIQPLHDHTHCSQGHFHHEDLHFWLSLKELRPQLVTITSKLTSLWPKNKTYYQERLKELLSAIDTLDKKVTALLAPAKGRSILTSHSALAYFCRDYGLTQLTLECSGKSPLPQDLDAILQKAEENHPLCAITFPYHSQKALLLIAKKLALPTYSIEILNPDLLATIEDLASDIAAAFHSEHEEV